MRRSTRFARAPRKRAVWVNIPFGYAFGESASSQLLLVPEDWEASFTGLTNERAVLRAIVGELSIVQTAVGTAGGACFWGIYLAGIGKPAPAFTTSGMSDVSWLLTGARSTTTVVTGAASTFSKFFCDSVHIKAKRRLTTNDQISIAAQFSGDPAAPTGIVSGILRFLVARD